MRSWMAGALLCASLASTLPLGAEMQIIAHRGSSYAAPENTVAAYRLAWEQSSDAAECDIYLTTDKRVILAHDSTTSRTAGVELKVSACSSEQLRKLDVGRWKNAKYTGERMPFLEEVLEILPAQKTLYVEIKCGAEVLPYLKEVLAKSGKASQIAIIGFDLDTVAKSKELMPEYPTYWLRGTVTDKKTDKPLPHDPKWIEMVKARKLDGLDVHFAGVTEEFVKKVREAGLGLVAWTVNNPDEAKRLNSLGLDGLTTDRPDLMREQLQKR